ncbi:MAG: hypothetical protein GWP61_11185 [Chloroflexi bacterium]|jgi:hypothetical protein|nr:hypothetical protein [Chloroflexota bacterium]
MNKKILAGGVAVALYQSAIITVSRLAAWVRQWGNQADRRAQEWCSGRGHDGRPTRG